MNDINLKNIRSFISGNFNYYKNKILTQPLHLKEQYYYRLYQCKNDCLPKRRCIKCNCPVIKKAWSTESCNTERFPNFLSGQQWKEYKEKHNINNIEQIIKDIENDDLFKGRL